MYISKAVMTHIKLKVVFHFLFGNCKESTCENAQKMRSYFLTCDDGMNHVSYST